MNAKTFLHESVLSLSTVPGCYPSQGARWYIEKGEKIPDDLLPGRLVAKINKIYLGLLAQLSSKDVADVALWWAKLMCS